MEAASTAHYTFSPGTWLQCEACTLREAEMGSRCAVNIVLQACWTALCIRWRQRYLRKDKGIVVVDLTRRGLRRYRGLTYDDGTLVPEN